MSGVDTGGQAYPGNHSYVDGYPSNWEGKTLRDWFAGEALSGLVEMHHGVGVDPINVARAAYQYADAMVMVKRETDPKPRAYDADDDRPF